ncbi:MAG: MFS transporter [Planctomycetes bacterium]|nr:MFS transporter [Planctomycetota bacterium]
MSEPRLYNREFFQVFATATLTMTGYGLQFHFGQFMDFLGYGVDVLGWVTGIAMVSSIAARPFLGGWIDRVGCRPVWISAGLTAAGATFAMQYADTLWWLILLRSVGMVAWATVMAAVIVYATQVAPPHRRAESVGVIGLGGLVGMTIGPTIGDWVFSSDTNLLSTYQRFFTISAACMAAGCLMILNVGYRHRPARPPEPSDRYLHVVRKHWPGTILLIGLVFSMTFTIPSVYLERLAEQRGFNDITLFFLCYAPTAIILRIIFRRLPQQIGRGRTMLIGMAFMSVGVLCLIPVSQEWHLMLAGCLMGSGHCFTFPSMVDLAAGHIPLEKRGMGMSLILGAGDVGALIGFIVNGQLIDRVSFNTCFIVMSVLMLATATLFALRRGRAQSDSAALGAT